MKLPLGTLSSSDLRHLRRIGALEFIEASLKSIGSKRDGRSLELLYGITATQNTKLQRRGKLNYRDTPALYINKFERERGGGGGGAD